MRPFSSTDPGEGGSFPRATEEVNAVVNGTGGACVALLSLAADRLEAGGALPIEPIDVAVELAPELFDDRFGCAAACRAAADSLRELLDGAYERA